MKSRAQNCILRFAKRYLVCLQTLCLVIGSIIMLKLDSAQSQSVITFDNPWVDRYEIDVKNYYDQGFWFRVATPPGSPYYNTLSRFGPGVSYYANNGTPHLEFSRDYALMDNVVFSITLGGQFGITSVDLAEHYPNISGLPITVTFIGIKQDGSSITNTFTTDAYNDGQGGLADFQTFNFDPSFGSGLIRVEIPSDNWAMDNIVIVPEPSTWAFLLAGLGVLAFKGWRRRF